MLSSLAFFAVCSALALLFWRVAGRKTRDVPAWAVAATAILPAVLITVCLTDAVLAGRFGELRLSLLEIEARLSPGDALLVGGDRERDDLVVRGWGNAMVSLRAAAESPNAPVGIEVQARPARPGEVQALFAVGRRDKLAFHGAMPFANGDAVCLSRCQGADAKWFVLTGRKFAPARVSEGRMVADRSAAGLEMPTRKVARAIPFIAYWAPSQAIHPLRDHLPAASGPMASNGCGTRLYCLPAARGKLPTPPASFLYRVGGLGGAEWRLMLLDPEARYAPDGILANVRTPDRGPLVIPADGSRVISLWEARYSTVAPTTSSSALSRLVERRSILVSNNTTTVSVTLDTPETLVLGGCSGDEVAAARMIGDPRAVSEGAMSFQTLGGASAQAAAGPLALPERNCGQFQTADIALGNLEVTGKLAETRLDRMGFPLPMLLIALFWAAVSGQVQSAIWSRNRLAWTLLGLTQTLLAIRWLIALAGATADPALDWRPIVGSAGAAYILCPALLLLATRPEKRLAEHWIGLGLFVAGALAGMAAWTGRPGNLTIGLIALFYGGLIAMAFLSSRPALLKAAESLAARLRGTASECLVATIKPEAVLRRVDPWMWWLGVALLLRSGLILVGVKERLGVAVSAVYTPMLIFGFSDLLARARSATGPARWRLYVWFLACLAMLVVLLPAGLAHDNGYALTTWLPLTVLPVVYALTAAKGQIGRAERIAWSAPAAGFALGMAGALLMGVLLAGTFLKLGVTDSELRAAAESDDDRPAVEILARQAALSDNMLRIAALAMPEQLANAGTAEAENLGAWSSHLASYTSQFFGRGYLSPSRLNGTLRPVQMDDNLSAIHLMSPFGRLGAAALLALLAAAALSCARMTRPAPREPDRTARSLAGLMALWVLFGGSAYVIFANLQLTLFTGRNVFLLAGKSGSDLLEGFSLVLIALWGLSARARESR